MLGHDHYPRDCTICIVSFLYPPGLTNPSPLYLLVLHQQQFIFLSSDLFFVYSTTQFLQEKALLQDIKRKEDQSNEPSEPQEDKETTNGVF
jgi:hypothetical protein